MIRVAINGFGRIGRVIYRIAAERKGVSIVAINDLTDTKTLAHLLKYDSVHGRFNGTVSYDANNLIVNGKKIPVTAESDPLKLPWKKHNVDIVLECTGRFLTKDLAQLHLKAGAKKVILSAPAKSDDIKTIVIGVNDHTLTKKDSIISNASCTTNCFAPLMKVLHDTLVVQKGCMVTAHAYTADQNLVDGPHKDLGRARHAAINLIPTSSGIAQAISQVIPALGGKLHPLLHASAIRVPVADGSLCYAVCLVKKQTTTEKLNTVFKKLSDGKMKGIISYSEDEIVSSDVIGTTASCIFDPFRTVVDGTMIQLMAWYDNEWGYSCRMVDLIGML